MHVGRLIFEVENDSRARKLKIISFHNISMT